MPSSGRFAQIAVSGPPRQSFTYALPPNLPELSPGQRLVVPFGRAKKVGYFLEYTGKPVAFKTRNIYSILDRESYFTPELNKLLRWMADYYFANPADCFALGLPPGLRSGKAVSMAWSGEIGAKQILESDLLPPEIRRLARPGKKLSALALVRINEAGADLLRTLMDERMVVEQWPISEFSERQKVVGYRVADPERFDKQYAAAKFSPTSFDGVKSRIELKGEGWTDYQLRKAHKADLLTPVLGSAATGVLDFIHAREDVVSIQLTNEQKDVWRRMQSLLSEGFKPVLLHGVTGSGKTITYCHICRDVLEQGKTALVLTPEIALTGPALAYFRGFFADKVTVIHSAMTDRERLESFEGVRSGKFRIVVGPRSALFAPLPNLGIIIVDEEHDSSYKQDDPAPRFHGRDCAVMRAKINRIPVLLGSASPSVESYHNALSGRYELLKLSSRPGKSKLPLVQVVDMKSSRLSGDLNYFSHELKREIDSRLETKEQVILYLNRRGFSPCLKCSKCGHAPSCENCQTKLVYHKVGKKLSCHYCGFVIYKYDSCVKCQGRDFVFQGVGIQKVEENLPRLFESARTLRLDSDVAFGRKKSYQILRDFADRRADLLLGTQMVTKGLDLPEVTLVGVLSADASFDLPDFRASEKAFSRLLQVSGRSGRADRPGRVLIQTYYPDNEVIAFAAAGDYAGFYEQEIMQREKHRYPPFVRLVNFVLSSKNEGQLSKIALSFRNQLTEKIAACGLKTELLGPGECPLYFLRGVYRRHLFVKTKQTSSLLRMLDDWERSQSRFGLSTTVKLTVDVDPDNMM